MRTITFEVLIASVALAGCTQRSLDRPDDVSTAPTPNVVVSDAPLPTCTFTPVVLAKDVHIDADDIAFADGSIFYPSDGTLDPTGEQGISVVSLGGGDAASLISGVDAFSQWLTASDHHLFFVSQTCAGVGLCSLIDFDLSAKTTRSYFHSLNPAELAANDAVVIAQQFDHLIRLDRTTGATRSIALPVPVSPYGRQNVELVGRHAAYAATDGSVMGYDLDDDSFAQLAPPSLAITIIVSHGDELLALGGNALYRVSVGASPVLVAQIPVEDYTIAFDDNTIYSAPIDLNSDVHVTPRDGSEGCAFHLTNGQINSISVQDGKAYVVSTSTDASQSVWHGQLARIDR